MPALHRAVALAQVDAAAVRVGKDLHLDVAGVDHGPLEDQFVGAEGARGLGARRRPARRRSSCARGRGACRGRRRRPRP